MVLIRSRTQRAEHQPSLILVPNAEIVEIWDKENAESYSLLQHHEDRDSKLQEYLCSGRTAICLLHH